VSISTFKNSIKCKTVIYGIVRGINSGSHYLICILDPTIDPKFNDTDVRTVLVCITSDNKNILANTVPPETVVYIDQADYTFLPHKSAVNCNKIHEITLKEIVNNAFNRYIDRRRIYFVNQGLIDKIYESIKASKTVKRSLKKFLGLI
jgi:hypothetical protein